MSFPFFPTVARAIATGAAFETGKQLAHRRGLGFLQVEGGADDATDWGGYNFDPFGNYFEYDWFDFNSGGGGGGDYWPSFDPFTLPELNAPNQSASGNEDRYWFDWGQYLSDWLSGNVLSLDTYAQGNGGRTPYGSGGSNFPDWLPGPGPASIDPQYGPAGNGAGLPGYCPQGQYHPLNDPYACVPFPADAQGKKQAQQQQKAQQQAAQQARKAQQQQSQTCPKDPQGRPVWKNPATGKCELIPTCPQGQKFDQVTRRCLTQSQLSQMYGSSNWLLWLLIGGGALVLLSNSGSGGRRR